MFVRMSQSQMLPRLPKRNTLTNWQSNLSIIICCTFPKIKNLQTRLWGCKGSVENLAIQMNLITYRLTKKEMANEIAAGNFTSFTSEMIGKVACSTIQGCSHETWAKCLSEVHRKNLRDHHHNKGTHSLIQNCTFYRALVGIWQSLEMNISRR